MSENEVRSRVKKTGIGLSLAAIGLITMFASPYIALRLSVLTGILAYHLVFLAGFVSLLYGAGYVLLANNLWGS
ncbi:MAG: hypothetical protein JW880_08595 [Candidatus Thermoplasmatota archaeon]|nr:hypothetical protein [Candidatus Thermoplasmatota archaeon]